MAADLTGDPADARDALAAEGAPMAARRRPGLYNRRFAAVYMVLGLAVAAALAGVALAVVNGRTPPIGPPWSPWQPTGAGLGAARLIAKHVAAEYTLPDGHQLLAVITRRPLIADNKAELPIRYVATRGPKGGGQQVDVLSGSSAVMYTLCGLGASCTIATGKPSVARGNLVRREILELALYTFRYDQGVQSVIAVMPPPNTKTHPSIVYLRRADLAAELAVPLADTLSPKTPGVGKMSARETSLVNTTTLARAYTSSVTRAQDGNIALILTRPKHA